MNIERRVERDPLFEEAAILIFVYQQGRSSVLQHKLSIGYNRASKIMDQLEEEGLVGRFRGSEGRKVNFDGTDHFVKFLGCYLSTATTLDINGITTKRIANKIVDRLKDRCGLS